MQPVKIPKTPPELYLKHKKYDNIEENGPDKQVIIVNYMDHLYSKEFIDDYFKS
jgi:hypothetical protein